jgi:hypothetical protein
MPIKFITLDELRIIQLQATKNNVWKLSKTNSNFNLKIVKSNDTSLDKLIQDFDVGSFVEPIQSNGDTDIEIIEAHRDIISKWNILSKKYPVKNKQYKKEATALKENTPIELKLFLKKTYGVIIK